jgi:hypothetical protein
MIRRVEGTVFLCTESTPPPPHSKVEDGSGKQFSSLTPTSAIDLAYQLAEMPSKNENERIKIWKVSGTKTLFIRRRTVRYRSIIVGKQGWDRRNLLLVSVAERPMNVRLNIIVR